MPYQVFALKYRPQTFDEVVGQEHVTHTLKNALSRSRISHAFLFTGPRGVGKTSVARILSRALNCGKGPAMEPCNECTPCKEILNGSSLDVLEIDGASHNSVDSIREIVENIRYLPSHGRYKIYIIDEVHMLSTSAFNALLKTLEEPPAHAVFIFATTEPHKIPATVVSRCQRYDFRRLPLRLIVDRLSGIAHKEGIEAGEGALFLAAREAFGSMRDAQVLLDQAVSYAGRTFTEADLIEMLGIPERRLLYDLSSAILARNAARCLDILERTFAAGHDLKRLGEDLLEHFRNLLVLKIAGPDTRLIDLPQAEIDSLAEQSTAPSPENLHLYFRALTDYIESLPRSPSPRIHMEMALARLASLPDLSSIGDIIRRLEGMEEKMGGGREGLQPPPVRTASGNAGQATAPLPSRGGEEPGWKQFLDFIRGKSPPVASYLDHGMLLGSTEGKIVLGFPPKSIFREHLQDNEKASALKKLAEDFYGRAVKIEFAEIAEPSGNPGTRSAADPENSVVKEALRIFGGAIVEDKKL